MKGHKNADVRFAEPNFWHSNKNILHESSTSDLKALELKHKLTTEVWTELHKSALALLSISVELGEEAL